MAAGWKVLATVVAGQSAYCKEDYFFLYIWLCVFAYEGNI
jgi:hypothetical protein